MKLYHATSRQNLPSILAEGLRVAKADPRAKIKGCWLATASNQPWSVLHTMRKHRTQLEDVVIIEVNVPRGRLTRFRMGLYYTTTDIAPGRLSSITPGEEFGRSASE